MTGPIERAARVDQDIDPPFSPLERAALVLMREDYPDEFCEDGSLTEGGQLFWNRKGFYYLKAARAVIAAIREPSEAMVAVGKAGGDWPHAAETWQAMIGAALAEGE